MREEGLGLGFLERSLLTHLQNLQSGTIQVHLGPGVATEGQGRKLPAPVPVFTMG